MQQIRQMIADVDKDGSGAIDFDEFVHMMTAKIGERDSKEELMKAFHIIDQDKNVKHLLCTPFFVIGLWKLILCHLSIGKDICPRHSANCKGAWRELH